MKLATLTSRLCGRYENANKRQTVVRMVLDAFEDKRVRCLRSVGHQTLNMKQKKRPVYGCAVFAGLHPQGVMVSPIDQMQSVHERKDPDLPTPFQVA